MKRLIRAVRWLVLAGYLQLVSSLDSNAGEANPTAPAITQVTVLSNGLHRVSWTPYPGAEQFRILSSTNIGSPYTEDPTGAISDGMFYRTIVESGWNRNHALAGVSIQSNLPQCLRGEQPMTNLSSIGRYNLIGVVSPSSSTNTDRVKLLNAIDASNFRAHPQKDNREMVHSLGIAFRDTLDIFQDSTFATNEFYDSDGTTHLFPINSGSDQKGLGSGAYSYFQNLKSAAQVLVNTDAVIAGTEMGGYDTHSAQVTSGSPHLGGHANLLKRVGWTFHALSKFFSNPAYNTQGRNLWNDVVVITVSEFGRTSAENASVGTDHAEASVMYMAGGGVTGGVYGCSTNQRNGQREWDPGTGLRDGSLFAANNSVGYLKRLIDYRSVLGESSAITSARRTINCPGLSPVTAMKRWNTCATAERSARLQSWEN